MKAPVALILFNRPELTEKVFARIADSRPEKLFLIADGPREGNEKDTELCKRARQVVEKVDWECEVYKNFSEENLGCGVRPATGIDWVFETVDRAIILEDDCLPDPTFFRFCDELLELYKDDDRVMQINGDNFQIGHIRTEHSYYFSEYPLTWGWATWRRAWKHYDYQIKQWQELRNTDFPLQITRNPDAASYWRINFETASNAKSAGDISFWDYQWTFAFWLQRGLSISPRENLVMNVGFGEDATHTTGKNNPHAYTPAIPMSFPMDHPPNMLVNSEADKFFIDGVSKKLRFLQPKKIPFTRKVRNKIVGSARKLKKQLVGKS